MNLEMKLPSLPRFARASLPVGENKGLRGQRAFFVAYMPATSSFSRWEKVRMRAKIDNR